MWTAMRPIALVEDEHPEPEPREPLRRHRGDHGGARRPLGSATTTRARGSWPACCTISTTPRPPRTPSGTVTSPPRCSTAGSTTRSSTRSLRTRTRRHASRRWTWRSTRPIPPPASSSQLRWCGPRSRWLEVSSVAQEALEREGVRPGASREQMATCEELGLERDEFLQLSLEAMQARADELGL